MLPDPASRTILNLPEPAHGGPGSHRELGSAAGGEDRRFLPRGYTPRRTAPAGAAGSAQQRIPSIRASKGDPAMGQLPLYGLVAR